MFEESTLLYDLASINVPYLYAPPPDQLDIKYNFNYPNYVHKDGWGLVQLKK